MEGAISYVARDSSRARASPRTFSQPLPNAPPLQDVRAAIIYNVSAGTLQAPRKEYGPGQRRKSLKKEKTDFAGAQALQVRTLLFHVAILDLTGSSLPRGARSNSAEISAPPHEQGGGPGDLEARRRLEGRRGVRRVGQKEGRATARSSEGEPEF